MLQQLKEILPEGWWGNIRGTSGARKPIPVPAIGSEVRFGICEQKEISGQHFDITEKRHYEFAGMDCQAYALSQNKKLFGWMIVVDDGQKAPYVALARPLNVRDQERIFSDDDIAALRKEGVGFLYAREHTSGYKGWIAMRYARKMQDMRGKRHYNGTARAFNYELYVNDDHSKAIEVERYLNGDVEVFATIYRPLSDVTIMTDTTLDSLSQEEDSGKDKRYYSAEVLAMPINKNHKTANENVPGKQKTTKSSNKTTPKLPEAPSAKTLKQKPLPETPNITKTKDKISKPEESKEAEVSKTEQDQQVKEARKHQPAFPPEITKQKAPKLEKQPNIPALRPKQRLRSGRMDCDLKTAGCLIDEALRQDMRMADVVRRILGLPVATNEMISFSFSLAEEDYKELAERYGLNEFDDVPQIHARIAEELESFATGGKEPTRETSRETEDA